jgi:hypothetical protein
VEELRRELAAGAGFVAPLPALPLSQSLEGVALDVLAASKVAVPKDLRHFPVLAAQLAGLRAFYDHTVNLERDGGKNKESTLDTVERHARRLAGFIHHGLGLPPDLRFACDGVVVAKFVVFIQKRKEKKAAARGAGGENHSYLVTTLAQLGKVFVFLATKDSVKAPGIEALVGQMKLFANQLMRVSLAPPLDTHALVDAGVAISFDDLAAKALEFSLAVLEEVEGGEMTSSSATKVQDALLAAALTQHGAQRTGVYTSLQIVSNKLHLVRPNGNYILISQGKGTCSLHINEHKMDRLYAVPPISIVEGSPLARLSEHWVSWAEDTLLGETFGCEAGADGCCFFSSKGVPYTPGTFYTKMISLFKDVTKNVQLKIGPRVLRHLLADSEVFATAPVQQQNAVAFLAGHSKKTEEVVYKSKVPSSKQLSDAAAFCYEAQVKHAAQKRASAAQGGGAADWSDDEDMQPPNSTPPKQGGNKVVHHATQPLLSPKMVETMSTGERKLAFEELYGKPTTSMNTKWLFWKLTGEHKAASPERKRTRVIADSSDSEGAL